MPRTRSTPQSPVPRVSRSAKLNARRGEACTPTLIGADGTIYAINDVGLCAIGS